MAAARRPDDRQQLRAWRVFLEVHAACIKALERELDHEAGLDLTWYDVLVQLTEKGGSLRMHQLADSLLLSRSATTRLVDRMEEEGLVERSIYAPDRRGMLVTATDRGSAVLRAASPVHLRGIEEHFTRHLGPTDAEALITILGTVLAGQRELMSVPG